MGVEDTAHATGTPDTTPTSGTDTFSRSTGIDWEEWLVLLEHAGGESLSHRQLARVAGALIEERGPCPNPDWWAQSVAIAFERHTGRREVGQVEDGTFQASCSRTLVGSLDEIAAAWALRANVDGLPLGLTWQGEPRVSSSGKWRYWRCGLSDGTRLTASVGGSPRDDRCVLTLTHEGLPDVDSREGSRAGWRAVLQEVTVPTM
ncbi:hypothetical protein [Actinomyces sp.]|uniref:hypothetical protein n=1 Tax=Actinomyces sp. TaxID=29317 RepID=UPI0028999496|nr:hypothetical protein [Actinomyces sp.]